jgi:hypothetical protein
MEFEVREPAINESEEEEVIIVIPYNADGTIKEKEEKEIAKEPKEKKWPPVYMCFVCGHIGPLKDVKMYYDELQTCPLCFVMLKQKDKKGCCGKEIEFIPNKRTTR